MEKKTYLPPETAIVPVTADLMQFPLVVKSIASDSEDWLAKPNDFFFEDFEDFDPSDEYDGVDEQHPFGSLFGSLWD